MPTPMTPIFRLMSFSCRSSVTQASVLRPVFVDVSLHRLAHVAPGFVRTLLPGEDAGGHDSVEADRRERGEELVPVHLALADVHVLMDRHSGARRIAYIAQSRRRLVIVGVGDMHVREHR